MMANHIGFYQFCSAVRRKGAFALCLALCMLGLGLSGRAQDCKPTFITFEAPGAGTTPFMGQGTIAWGNDAQGEITGWYIDASNVFHGYLRAPNGRFTTIDAPGAGTGGYFQGTAVYTLDANGEMFGVYFDENYVLHGFVRTP